MNTVWLVAALVGGVLGVAPVGDDPAPTAVDASGSDSPEIDKLWDFTDPAGTEAKFRALLPAAEGREKLSHRLQLLTQVARARGLQGRFDEAHATLDELEKVLARRPSRGLEAAHARYLLERGRVFNSAGRPEDARPLFERAWDMRELYTGLDVYVIDAAHMMGIAAETPDQQIEWNRKAIAAAERTADDRARRWLGPLYNNLGWTRHDRGEYAEALDLFRKALAFRQQRPAEEEPLRVAHWTVARAMRSLGRHDDALAMQRDLAAQYERAGKVSGVVFEEIAECLHARGNPDEARPWFAKAYPELVKEGWEKWEPARVRRVRELGGVE